MTESQVQRGPNPNYKELETVAHPDGVIAVITENISSGAISFGIYREFEREGKTSRGSYLARRHLPAVRELLADLEDRLEAIEDRARAKRRDRE